jgi:5,6-dimethylbenzimidazole synthase
MEFDFMFAERPMGNGPNFDSAFLGQLRDLFRWRRDVRRFSTAPLPAGAVEGLIAQASFAPSVGLSEPWRFVIVGDQGRRQAMKENFSKANAQALDGYQGERAKLYASLKLEGFEAPAQLAVFCDGQSAQGHGLGRATMPETAEYSVVAAIQLIWMMARAQGLGVGWVSILDPGELNAALDVPAHWKLVAYLCIGYPVEESTEPELARSGWEGRRDPVDFTLQR